LEKLIKQYEIGRIRQINICNLETSFLKNYKSTTDTQTDAKTDGQMDGQMDGQKDGRTEGGTDRQTDGQTYIQTDSTAVLSLFTREQNG